MRCCCSSRPSVDVYSALEKFPQPRRGAPNLIPRRRGPLKRRVRLHFFTREYIYIYISRERGTPTSRSATLSFSISRCESRLASRRVSFCHVVDAVTSKCHPAPIPPSVHCNSLPFATHSTSTETMGTCSLFEDGRGATIEKSRRAGTPSGVLRVIGAVENTSRGHTQPPQSPAQAHDGDAGRAHTVIQMAPVGGKNKESRRSTRTNAGALLSSQFALLLALALAPSSVQASTSTLSQSSSCVQITDVALHSSCASRGKVASFTFAMEGTTAGATAAHTVSSCVGGGGEGGRCLSVSRSFC